MLCYALIHFNVKTFYVFIDFSRSEIMEFVSTTGSWENVVKKDLFTVIEHYKKEGATSFGIFGFCWGGKVSIKAIAELDDIKSAALLHPSFLENADAEAVKGPVLFLPTKDEADLVSDAAIILNKLYFHAYSVFVS